MVLWMASKRMSIFWLLTFRCTTLFLICSKSPSTGKDASKAQLQKTSDLLFNLSISIAHLPRPSSHIPLAAPRSSSVMLQYLLLILQYYRSPAQTCLYYTALYRTKDSRGSRDSIKAQRNSGRDLGVCQEDRLNNLHEELTLINNHREKDIINHHDIVTGQGGHDDCARLHYC